MTRYFKPRTDILPAAQQRLWPELHPSIKLGLVLYGGTAIALRLGHRPSVDFDFFTEKPLDKTTLQAAFPFLQHSTVVQDEPNTYTVLVPYDGTADQHVKVSFFGTIGCGRIGEPEITNDGTLQVATLDDLMATKVKVILQRIEAKDYRDITAMVKAGVSLSKGLSAAREMYGHTFQPSESLKAMVYFEGGDLHTLTQDEKETLIAAASAVRDLPKVEINARELASPEIEPSDDREHSTGLDFGM
ncbi:MAG: nucleotidyl transferase AbiEii/AbiGii toxin family protein [Acidiferrobacteraceae bacterium]